MTRFARWVANGRQNSCLECFEQQIQDNLPTMRRKQVPADCPIHGHPELVTPHNTALLQLYSVVNDSTGLNSTVVYYCCQEYDLDFLPTYWQLKQIREIFEKEAQKVQDVQDVQDVTTYG